MKIAILPSRSLSKTIFSEQTQNALREYGELVINDEEKEVSAEKIKQCLQNADVAITSWGCPVFTKELLDECPKLKLVLHAAGSVKPVVSDELWDRGIKVSSSAEAIGQGVAETALGFAITALKNLWNLSKYTRDGEWSKGREQVKELTDITIGVIGGGRVGQYYIKLMKNFDVEILLYDPILTEEQAEALGAKKTGLNDLLKKSDLVSIHAPLIEATKYMLNRETLKLMKDDAIIVNTARGAIINEADLIEELEKGRLFACLDVTEQEPAPADSPLRRLPNVVLTPHIAGVTNNGMRRIGKYVVSELEAFLSGEKMRGEVTKEMLDILA